MTRNDQLIHLFEIIKQMSLQVDSLYKLFELLTKENQIQFIEKCSKTLKIDEMKKIKSKQEEIFNTGIKEEGKFEVINHIGNSRKFFKFQIKINSGIDNTYKIRYYKNSKKVDFKYNYICPERGRIWVTKQVPNIEILKDYMKDRDKNLSSGIFDKIDFFCNEYGF